MQNYLQPKKEKIQKNNILWKSNDLFEHKKFVLLELFTLTNFYYLLFGGLLSGEPFLPRRFKFSIETPACNNSFLV